MRWLVSVPLSLQLCHVAHGFYAEFVLEALRFGDNNHLSRKTASFVDRLLGSCKGWYCKKAWHSTQSFIIN